METRVCRICNVEKELTTSNFNKRMDANKVTFRTECTKCRSAYNLELYHKNSKQKENHRKCSWRHSIKKKYGLSEKDYNAMAINQNNSCAICKEHIDALRHIQLYVDHCHTTGAIRGLLCGNCNSGLGNFKDNIESLKQAIIYLKESNEGVSSSI